MKRCACVTHKLPKWLFWQRDIVVNVARHLLTVRRHWCSHIVTAANHIHITSITLLTRCKLVIKTLYVYCVHDTVWCICVLRSIPRLHQGHVCSKDHVPTFRNAAYHISLCLSGRAVVGQTTRLQVLPDIPVLCQHQQFSRVMSCQLAYVMNVVCARSPSSGVTMQWLVGSICWVFWLDQMSMEVQLLSLEAVYEVLTKYWHQDNSVTPF